MPLDTSLTFGLCCDHAGFELKEQVKDWLLDLGFKVTDFGTFSAERCDYPDFAHQLGRAIEHGSVNRGVAICGSGNGISMVVNKYPHARAALCWTPELAQLGRAHNDANVLSMPARFISTETAREILLAFLEGEFEGGRHTARVEKISALLHSADSEEDPAQNAL